MFSQTRVNLGSQPEQIPMEVAAERAATPMHRLVGRRHAADSGIILASATFSALKQGLVTSP
jgi:hypothetical protein